MKTIETTRLIEAPPEIVWQVITDFAHYPEWNPFITEIEGDLRLGGRLRATFTLPDRKPRTFTPVVTVLESGHRLTWLGRLLVPGLFDGEHTLAVEPDGDRARFTQSENFRGVLPPLMGGMLRATHGGFTAMNTALAERAQSIAGPR